MTPSHLPPPEDASFIAAIRADLEADAPRLVYADHLLERGDPRGELINVQCRIEHATGLEHRDLVRRERDLLRDHHEVWVAPFGIRGWQWTFVRGFLDRLYIPLRLLRQHWAEVGQLPLRRVTVSAVQRIGEAPSLGDLAWLTRQPEAATLEEIAVETNSGFASFDAEALRLGLAAIDEQSGDPVWAAGRGVPDARTANALCGLEWRWPDPTMTHDFVRGGALMRLERLVVGRAERLLPVDLRLLMAAPALKSVHTLSLGNLATDEAARIVLDAPALPRLTHFELSGQTMVAFGPDITRALRDSALLPGLVQLTTNAALDFDALAERAPSLSELYLGRALGRTSTERLLASPLVERLRILSLCGPLDLPDASALSDLALLVLVGADIPARLAEVLLRGLRGRLATVACTIDDDARALLETRWDVP